ncbi:hypothetical protein GJ496_002225 [Pomphorhynchus laevis]|nr:hypothetical protein GJ496_002225 [Pomphorhynchus laevis]
MANFGVIEIPLKDTDEVIELSRDQLPSINEALLILRQENCPLSVWIELALEYYRQEKYAEFVEICECGRNEASLNYENSENDQMLVLDSLAAFYVQQTAKEKDREKKKALFTQATLLYTTADKINMYDLDHLLGRAYLCLMEGEKIDQADGQFNFVLNQIPSDVPALLGRASISFIRKDYKAALGFYRRSLKLCPNCSAEIRVGIGHCLVKLNKLIKARQAFERALQLKPDSISALVGLAVLDINDQDPNSIKLGVQRLSRAYAIDSANPIVLNHLAEHFFFRKDYQKVKQLALHAFHNTENESIRSESCYQLARSYHCEGEYAQAFQYYYQSTQFAGSNFVLPQYGLGQMYIQRNDIVNAACCFKKVLNAHPESYETMKILGSILATSKNADDRQLAQMYLAKVTQRYPDDIEAWIERAQLLESDDPTESLKAYQQAMQIITVKMNSKVPCELLNNVGSLHFRLNNLTDAMASYKSAIVCAKSECNSTTNYKAAMNLVTATYNFARLYEQLSCPAIAERLYKKIVQSHPNYVDAVLRLGCMARDRGQIYEASDWFKDALQVNQENADAWSLIGNLHLVKQEWGPGQKKFERILHNPQNSTDAYSMIALGNVWLNTLYQSNRDRQKDKRHQARAINIYRNVLNTEPKNIWAVNGIGCVLAHKGFLNEARDLFAQVREVTADFKDVWLNIAHVYVEQGQYHPAVRMYESCYQKFCKDPDPELLIYLARALFRSGLYREALRQLLNARRVWPDEPMLLYNIALVQQQMSIEILRDERSILSSVLHAVKNLQRALKSFHWLTEQLQSNKPDTKETICLLADHEAQKCADLLSQAQYHVQRARHADERDKELRRVQEEQRKVILEQSERDKQEKRRELDAFKQEQQAKRTEYLNKARKLLEADAFDASNSTGNRKRSAVTSTNVVEGDDDFVVDSLDDSPTRSKGSKRKSRNKRSKRRDNDDSGSRKRKKDKHRKRSHRNRDKLRDKLCYSSDQNEDVELDINTKKTEDSRYKSKAFISSSSESEAEEEKAMQFAQSSTFENKPLMFAQSDKSDFSNADLSE